MMANVVMYLNDCFMTKMLQYDTCWMVSRGQATPHCLMRPHKTQYPVIHNPISEQHCTIRDGMKLAVGQWSADNYAAKIMLIMINATMSAERWAAM